MDIIGYATALSFINRAVGEEQRRPYLAGALPHPRR
jgi:hypothetical protein